MPRPFRFGVLSGIDSFSKRELQDAARRAEAAGYDVFQWSDHVAGPGRAMTATGHPPQGLAAVPALMALADATQQLRVSTLVSCIDYHHPAVIANEMASIDLLSDGRLEVGLGAGWVRGEYEALGIRFDPAPVRLERLAEAATLIKLLFAGGEVSFEGEHYRVQGVEGAPRPVQLPHPPIVIGGGSRRVLELAAREANIVSINYNNKSGKLGPEGYATGTEQATLRKIAWIREAAGDRYDDLEIHIGAYFTVITDDRASGIEQVSGWFGLPAAEIVDHPHVLVGSVESICEDLLARRERYGISYISVGAALIDAFGPVVARLAGT